MATTTSTPTSSTGRRVRIVLVAAFLVGIVVQFFLAGRGVFGASDYDAHKALGNVLGIVSLIILILTLAFRDTRNRVDIGLAGVLFVLNILQGILATFDHPNIGALHPVNALLITGAAAGILSRDRRLAASPGEG